MRPFRPSFALLLDELLQRSDRDVQTDLRRLHYRADLAYAIALINLPFDLGPPRLQGILRSLLRLFGHHPARSFVEEAIALLAQHRRFLRRLAA